MVRATAKFRNDDNGRAVLRGTESDDRLIATFRGDSDANRVVMAGRDGADSFAIGTSGRSSGNTVVIRDLDFEEGDRLVFRGNDAKIVGRGQEGGVPNGRIATADDLRDVIGFLNEDGDAATRARVTEAGHVVLVLGTDEAGGRPNRVVLRDQATVVEPERATFDQPLFAFDVAVEGGSVILADRITGERTTVDGAERFVFDGEEVTLAELRQEFGPAAPPAIRVSGGTQAVSVNDPDPTVSVVWDRAAQLAVIGTDTPVGPTVSSRAYALVHTAIYDAWAGLDPVAVQVARDADGDDGNLILAAAGVEGAQADAMSFAAHAVLSELFPDRTALFDTILTERYDLDPADRGPAAALGRDAAEDLMSARRADGSNADGGYVDTTGYAPVNPSPLKRADITRWTPENVPIDPEDGDPEQAFLTPHWGLVDGFALPTGTGGGLDLDALGVPDPQPFFVAAQAGATLDFDARTVTLGAPATIGGTSFGAGDVVPVDRSLIGPVIAPRFIEQAEVVIRYSAELDDRGKIIAEFWEDGGGTAFPPGTFMSFAQFVSARDGHDEDEDAALFLAMGNAMLDAGVATWAQKVEDDYARPVRVIRDLGELGLIGRRGTDELTDETGYVIDAWGGIDPATGEGLGTRTILAENFVAFQRPATDPSPPFAEYTSGHSAFSAAGAAVLRAHTGSDTFGGSVLFAPGVTQFERGVPSAEEVLSWKTFTEAADEAGLSRLYGGIHFEDGDFNSRELGAAIGEAAYERASAYVEGDLLA
jgi:hypothetical protein